MRTRGHYSSRGVASASRFRSTRALSRRFSCGEWHRTAGDFINACYPDAVNALLAALGPSDRLVGVTKSAIIESNHRGAFPKAKRSSRLYNSTSWKACCRPRSRIRRSVYDGRQSVSAHSGRNSASRDTWYGVEWVTGASVSRLIGALVADRPFSGSVPGPLGEIGGYPVTVARGAITIDLPTGVSMTEARDIDTRAALREGVVVRDGAAPALGKRSRCIDGV